MTREGRLRSRLAFGLAVALVSVSCSTGTPPQTMTAAPTSGTSRPTATAGPTTPDATSAGPTTTPQPTSGSAGTPEPSDEVPLPEPSLTEPSDIAQALFNPGQVQDGVASLLAAMGVAIYDSEGTLVRPGADRGAGELRLIEAEVRGFIAMTEEDLANAGESAGPISIADLHRGLATSLPVGYSVEEFAAAYAEAYAAEPASLAAQVMLGQPIEPETRLLRIQMWLLLVDGFVSPGETGIGRSPVLAAVSRPSSVGTVVARLPAGATLGAAARFQPPLTSPMAGVSNTDWARVLARLPFLAYGVPFVVEGDGILIHEGHGRLGHNLQLTARFLRPRDLEQGQLLVRAKDIGCCLTITWDTSHESVLRDHGEVVGSLFTPMLTDDSGAVSIGYQVKEEVENRQNFSFPEYVTLYPRVDQLALVIWASDLPVEIFEVIRTESLITGTRVADSRGFGIGWHDEGFWQV